MVASGLRRAQIGEAKGKIYESENDPVGTPQPEPMPYLGRGAAQIRLTVDDMKRWTHNVVSDSIMHPHDHKRRSYSSNIPTKFCNLSDMRFNKRKLALDDARTHDLRLTDINDAGILIAMPSCSSLVITSLDSISKRIRTCGIYPGDTYPLECAATRVGSGEDLPSAKRKRSTLVILVQTPQLHLASVNLEKLKRARTVASLTQDVELDSTASACLRSDLYQQSVNVEFWISMYRGPYTPPAIAYPSDPANALLD
ncbi:uncharacterized protein LACBIDRAFT_325676 [Laccaria bicolor S238N-H82]|uniref:Predicted protein n=1 Tax=Laccaria bicolor (strain S238N-H82 / ATCC MYA-4686) TaxID=486041 RepID=B0D5U7_LACBS|nr:uncharacterized protein LACBIDRAFT_325676 [Laccaria bicolor S238N-H82]EDR10080.1 predicted protein [Laccaria bicolor S238N-H82]|eukprot:XP_001879465.1 predicted protein [Laccaria bicolor S238N-H82]